jgi:transporter family-2 protein
MTPLLLPALIAVAGGVAVGLQGPLTSMMSQRLGTLESVFIVHIGGTLIAMLPLIFLGGGHLAQWRGVPWYALMAGALGVVILSAVSFTIPRLGASSTVTLLIAAELVVSAILDHYGLLGVSTHPIGLQRMSGFALLMLATWLVVR